MSKPPRGFAGCREQYIDAILQVAERIIDDAGLAASSIAAMLDYQMETGGKRIRAVLPLMVAEALGRDPAKMVAFGAACELIHNATLVHDDLQDGDRLRRGQPAAWVQYGSERAINLGDALLYLAPLCLEEVDVDAGVRWAVTSQICRQVLRVIDGQQREFDLAVRSATPADYRRMVSGKTSGLFALPMAGAARLLEAPQPVVDGLEEAARHLGILFQIQDDILDLYGDKGRDAPGGDIREGKVSALVVAFVDRAPDADVDRLVSILEADREATAVDDVEWAIEEFRRSGAVDEAFDEIDDLAERARTVASLEDYPELRSLIEELTRFIVEPIDDVR